MAIIPQTDLAPGGPHVSRLVVGLWRLESWNLSPTERLDWLYAVLELGFSTFDLADIYGDYTCERLFGEALALAPSVRDQMQLVTKCGIQLVSPNRPSVSIKHYDTSAAHVIASVEQSLALFHTDRIDLLLIHRPDPLMDPDEIATAFSQLHRQGKVLHFGVSNFLPSQFELLASRLDVPLVTNQIEISVLRLDAWHDGTLHLCQRYRVAPMAWSPLGGGRLFTDAGAQVGHLRKVLAEVGADLGGASIDQVALAWLLQHPAGIVPILGSGKVERLERAAAALNLQLGRQQWFSIWRAATGRDVP